MDYVYGAVWLIVAFLLIFKMSKENKIFYFLGGYFAILGAWWLINARLVNVDLFAGVYLIILRCISAVAIIVVTIFYYKNYFKKKKK